MYEMIAAINKASWEKIRPGTQEMEVADTPCYCSFGQDKPYRLVIGRIKRRDSHTDMSTGEAYTYRGILTNDTESTSREVVAFNNARGESERHAT